MDVVFKGNKNGIDVILDKEISYDNLKLSFRQKLVTARDFFGDCRTEISFKGRELSENQEGELLDIISNETGLDISFVNKSLLDKNIFLEPKSLPAPEIILQKELNPLENVTRYHRGSIRNGQSVEFDGSVVIVGDVNPGGEVKAAGNVVILGALKGFAYAGKGGPANCFIWAQLMKPIQMRIGDFISYIPKEAGKSKKFEPSIAYVENGQIYVKSFV
jgi:septum site-determining protein MinC